MLARSSFFFFSLLKVPLCLTLKNCSWNRTSKYTLELLPWSDKAVGKSSLNIFPFHWTGSTVFSGSLEPDVSVDIHAFATFQLPGVYDVNRWKLTVQTDDKEDAEVFIHQPSLPQLISALQQDAAAVVSAAVDLE